MTSGERIKQLRKEKGLTQTALGEMVGVTKGTVSSWETNTRTPGFETLMLLCDIFERRLEYILGRSDDATPPGVDSEEDMEDLALSQVEDDLTEYALKYARLDKFGQDAVEAIIRAEYNRCRIDNTLGPAAAYYGRIRIKREPVEE